MKIVKKLALSLIMCGVMHASYTVQHHAARLVSASFDEICIDQELACYSHQGLLELKLAVQDMKSRAQCSLDNLNRGRVVAGIVSTISAGMVWLSYECLKSLVYELALSITDRSIREHDSVEYVILGGSAVCMGTLGAYMLLITLRVMLMQFNEEKQIIKNSTAIIAALNVRLNC